MRPRVAVRAAENGGSLFGSWTTVGTLFPMFAAALLLAACGGEEAEQTTPAEDVESEGPDQAVTLTDITESPGDFVGTTVSGEVNELVGPRTFTIGHEDFLGTDELLIVGARQLPNITEAVPEGEPTEIAADDIVQITGAVVGVAEPTVFTMSRQADADVLADEDFDVLAEEDAIPVVNSTGGAPGRTSASSRSSRFRARCASST